MAIAQDTTLVGSGNGNGVVTLILSNTSTGGADRLVLVLCCQSNDAGFVSSVTAAGLTFSLVSRINNVAGQGWTEVWGAWAASQQTNTAITIQYPAGSFPQCAARTQCWSGTDATGTVAAAVGATNTAGSAGSTTPSVALTTTRANSRVVAAVGDIGNTTLTAGTNQTNDGNATSAGGFAKVFDLYQNADTAATSTSVTMNGTLGASQPNGIVAVEVKAPVATTPTTTRPVNQPLKQHVLKRQQPRSSGYPFPPRLTTSRAITAVGNLRALVTVEPSTWKQPVNEPSTRHYPVKRQQLPRPNRFSQPVKAVKTITAVGNIRSLASVEPSAWLHPTNQDLRNHIPRRQQLPRPTRFSQPVRGVQTITAVGNLRSLVSVEPSAWLHPVNQDLRNHIPRRQQLPRPVRFSQPVLGAATITAVGNIRALVTVEPSAWLHPTNQYLRNRVPRRMQLPRAVRFSQPVTTPKTITAVANLRSLTSVEPSAWLHPTNQDLRNHVPKRVQLPRPYLFSQPITTKKTITAVGNIRSLVSVEPTAWAHPVNQYLRSRVPKRVQLPRPLLFSQPLTTTKTITARANIAGVIFSWFPKTNQPLANRVPKRQQPIQKSRGSFLITVTTVKTITAVGNIKSLVSVEPSSWMQPTNQYLRSRVPRRQQYMRPVRFSQPVSRSQTITAVGRLIALSTVDVALWAKPTNQPARRRYPVRRLQPVIRSRGAFLASAATTTQTITAVANLLGTPLVTTYIHPTNQPPRRRYPVKRQQPNYLKGRMPVVVGANITTTQTITARGSILSTNGSGYQSLVILDNGHIAFHLSGPLYTH